MKHYFHCEGIAAILDIPEDFPTPNWAMLFDAFQVKAVPDPDKRKYTSCSAYSMYDGHRFLGVYFDEELANSDGSYFTVLKPEFSTEDEISICINHIRRTRDVVKLRVIRPRKWVQEWAEETLKRIITP